MLISDSSLLPVLLPLSLLPSCRRIILSLNIFPLNWNLKEEKLIIFYKAQHPDFFRRRYQEIFVELNGVDLNYWIQVSGFGKSISFALEISAPVPPHFYLAKLTWQRVIQQSSLFTSESWKWDVKMTASRHVNKYPLRARAGESYCHPNLHMDRMSRPLECISQKSPSSRWLYHSGSWHLEFPSRRC